jgi:hypothetical protein
MKETLVSIEFSLGAQRGGNPRARVRSTGAHTARARTQMCVRVRKETGGKFIIRRLAGKKAWPWDQSLNEAYNLSD